MRRPLVGLVFVTALAACEGGEEPGNAGWSTTNASVGANGSTTGASSSTGCLDGCGGQTGVCQPASSHEGEATYYDFADGSGNCSFDPSPDDLMVGAMNHVDYAGSNVCGACVNVVGPQGNVAIRIVDQCPECPQGDIDLSPEAFERIAELSAGRVPIQWSYESCPVEGPIEYFFKEGSNPWWTAVQLRNYTNAIATFEYLRDGAYRSVPRESYNYFVESDGMGEGPYSFRVTDVFGHVVEDIGIAFVEAGASAGSSQFPACAP